MPTRAHKNKTNLAWIDLEMTGLCPERDVILEMASVVTDKNLNVIAEGPHAVIHHSAAALRRMNAWNRKHHGKSGLIDDVRRSKTSIRKAETETLRFLKSHCTPGSSPLCGNSIWQDRRFLMKYMPTLNRFFHYRNVDVSSIKVLVRLWYPGAPKPPAKKGSHRALADIYESIKEMRYYRDVYFKALPKTSA